MIGGNLPANDPILPEGFEAALQGEMKVQLSN
jgi:hypothetical protein